jgi:glyoxylase-like metal-dependent hydrolase (beta-lactamase superfamily II)
MKFKQSGKVTEGFYVVGNPAMPIYLLDGKVPVLFDSGVAPLADQYERHIKAILGQRAPGHLLLTHSHFDHVGAAARLKRLFPKMQIAGSARLEEIVNRPRAIELIRKLNRDAGEYILSMDPEARPEEPFEPFELDRALNHGESISIGDELQIEVLATPGHTRDFLS